MVANLFPGSSSPAKPIASCARLTKRTRGPSGLGLNVTFVLPFGASDRRSLQASLAAAAIQRIGAAWSWNFGGAGKARKLSTAVSACVVTEM